MSESVNRSNEIIFRFLSGIFGYNRIQYFIVRISKEYRFDIRIIHPNMFHAVFFFIAACQFVLFNYSVQIIIYIRTYHQAILRFTVHGLRIDIILFLFILK